MYWTLIEMGLSIIAACLPTLRPLFGNVAAQSWSNMLRSFFTLPSRLRSTSENRKGMSKGPRPDGDTASNSSRVKFAFKAMSPDSATEIYPMRDIESQAAVPREGIMVQNKITQTFST